MAFGQLTTKFRIFRRNLDYAVEKNALIVVVAAKLHNYVINNDSLHFQTAGYDMAGYGVESLIEEFCTQVGHTRESISFFMCFFS